MVIDPVILSDQPLPIHLQPARLLCDPVNQQLWVLLEELGVLGFAILQEFDKLRNSVETKSLEQAPSNDLDYNRGLLRVLILELPNVLALLQHELKDVPGAVFAPLDVHGHADADHALQNDEEAIAQLPILAQVVTLLEHFVL